MSETEQDFQQYEALEIRKERDAYKKRLDEIDKAAASATMPIMSNPFPQKLWHTKAYAAQLKTNQAKKISTGIDRLFEAALVEQLERIANELARLRGEQ